MKKLIVLISILFCSVTVAQTISLEGLVSSSKNEILPYVNVILLRVKDSSVYKGSISDENGHYKIDNIYSGSYMLKVSSLGFQTKQLPIEIIGDTVQNVSLSERLNNLDEVVVISKKPTLDRKIDRLIFNVENTIVSENNTWDIIRNTPGVIIDQNNIMIKNSTNITVYMNDTKVQIPANEIKSYLESLSGTMVKAIEVITTPPARYDAEGGAILLIRTKQNLSEGYKGSINYNYTQARLGKHAIGTSQFFKLNKVDLNLNYTFSPQRWNQKTFNRVNYLEEDNSLNSRWNANWNRSSRKKDHNFRFQTNYQVTTKNSISFTVDGFISPDWEGENESTTNILNSSLILDSLFVTNNTIDRDKRNFSYNLDYKINFKKDGERLNINAHFTDYKQLEDQLVDTDYFLPSKEFIRDNTFLIDNYQKIDIYSSQIDYELPINSSILEIGTKVSFIDSDNDLKYFNRVDGTDNLDNSRTNNFLYKESNYAFYSSYGAAWKKWDFKLGLRGEYTDLQGESKTTSEINENDYFKIFPTVYMQFEANENNVISLKYAKRISRPRYRVLNPFRYYLNDNSYYVGNPELKPTIIHEFSLLYTINDKYNFDISYSYEKDPIYEFSIQDNILKTLEYTNLNTEKDVAYSLDFNTYTNITSFWNIYFQSTVQYQDIVFKVPFAQSINQSNSSWVFYSYLGNYLTLSKDKTLTGDLTFFYLSPYLNGADKRAERIRLSLGFKKELFDNKMILTLNFNDILNSDNVITTTQYQNQDIFSEVDDESQYVRIGLRYNFGNTKLKDKILKKDKLREQQRID
ncbi:outer membrane beta-barrel protein [Aquimarina sp. 2-A2]|uniref:outer membrane beta-barrel protein n=1 Tax=Aquimarina sp. 2-A2 TaxID=3382644 RepID=UPI00387F1C6C